MLVDPDERAVDEDVFEIRIVGEGLENALPDTLLRPAPEARIDGAPLAERFRKISPRDLRLCPTAPAQSAPIGCRSTSIESRLISIFSLESIFNRFGNPDCKQALALQLCFLQASESMGNHDSNVVGAGRVG